MQNDTWTALAEPRRRAVLDLLIGGERTVGDIAASVGLSQPTASKHLKVLRDAGFVSVRQAAQQRWYDIAPEPFDELADWLQPYRRRWNASLDRLGEHLDRTTTPDRTSTTDPKE